MSDLRRGLRRLRRDIRGTGPFERFARAGYLARGVIYVLMGALAVQLARGVPSDAPSQEGAMRLIADRPFGRLLLVLLAVGLAGYVALRVTQAFVGRTDEAGRHPVVDRVAAFGSGIAYALFLVLCVALVAGIGDGDHDPRDATAEVLDLPGGRLLVAAAGALFVGIGAYQLHLGVTRGFLRYAKTQYMSPETLRRFTALGVVGHLARSAVFGLVGVFLVKAAAEYDAGEAVGIDGALRRLSDRTYGPELLLAVALGLIAFGAYSIADARHRVI